jgi:hypothetical protein
MVEIAWLFVIILGLQLILLGYAIRDAIFRGTGR